MEALMNAMIETFLKSLDPISTIKITNIDKGTVPIGLLTETHKYLSTKYKTYLDKEAGVIYIGKRI